MKSVLKTRWQKCLAGSVVVILMLALTGSALLAYLGSAANVIEAKVESPRIVLVGQPFDIYLTLHNTTKSEQTLVSIGMERALLEQGITLLETVPPYREADNLNNSNWVEYTFAIQRRPILLANETLRMRLNMQVTQPGTYQGSLTIWTKNQAQADYADLKLIAVEHPAPWLGH
jgi:hypothetical protein